MHTGTQRRICFFLTCCLTLGGGTSRAWAVKQFQDAFYARYLVDEKSDYASLVHEARCNLCHEGTDKTQRNTYGSELSKLLDAREDKGNSERIREALNHVSRLPSQPDRAGTQTFGQLIAAGHLPGTVRRVPPSSFDNIASPDEPYRDAFSFSAAVEYLDTAALAWQNDRKCFACHSNYAILSVRPYVSVDAPAQRELRAKLEELATHPRDVRYRVAEGVMAAAVLAENDALTTGTLHPATRQALDYMWTLQSEDGSFDWTKTEQPPSEVDDHFGVTTAVLAVGLAPDDYAETPQAQAGLAKMREYLEKTPPVNLHQRGMLLLGSLHVDGIMSEAERQATIDDLLSAQKPDGGWGIVSLGNWERYDGKPNDTASSDGYGTGFVVSVLRAAGVEKDHPQIQAGIAWLKANQRVSGRWFTRSQWKDSKHYLSNRGTAWAIRALAVCE